MRFDVVLFDLDHTLLDSDASMDEAYRAAMIEGGIDDPEGVRPDFDRINGALWRAVERGEIRPDDVKIRRFEQLLLLVGAPGEPTQTAQQMAEAFVDGLIRNGELLPGASSLLESLDDRPIGLVTNGIGRVQRGRLDRLGLADAFDVVVISGELDVAKPDPAIFDHALSPLGGPDRSRTAMVGDNWGSDVVGAAAAGLVPIWLDHVGGEMPPEPNGVLRVRSLAEVGELIR